MLKICERFGKLPSELDDEPGELLRLLQIEALGTPPPSEQEPFDV